MAHTFVLYDKKGLKSNLTGDEKTCCEGITKHIISEIEKGTINYVR